jgi:HEAT repeat protein
LTVIHHAKAIVAWLLVGLGCLAAHDARAQEEPNEELVQMVVELVSDADRDMRALGLQQIREEIPGEAATKSFVELLSKLPSDGQAELLEALGDRGDAAAKPAVLDMLQSDQEAVRAAALRALGALGGGPDVPMLAGKTAADSDLEKDAARQALIRLRGDGVNEALVSALSEGGPDVRVELLGVLAARNAKEALPTVMESANASELPVRLAALDALRYLADENDAATVVGIVKSAGDEAQRRKAELVLLAVCTRGGEACTDTIVAGLADADGPARIVLVHGLARAGGAKALEAIAARLEDEDDDEAVRDEAVRMLSIWPDPAVAPKLVEIAKASDGLRHQVLAIRGLVRLASPQGEKPADVKLLVDALGLAKRPEEKRLVLGAAGGIATAQSLAIVTPLLEDPALAEDAGLAVVLIAEKMEDMDQDTLRSALEKAGSVVKNPQLLERARKALESL